MSSRKKTDDPEIQKLQKNIHAGHRQRMRRRLANGGLEAFEDYEALEMLLFYAIPRRNTNEMAHMLIRRFGSLSAVLDASPKELQTIPGIGPNAARYIRLIPGLTAQLTRSRSRRPVTITGANSLRQVLDDRLSSKKFPLFCVLLLREDNTLLGTLYYPGAALPTLRRLVSDTVSTKATKLVLVECGTKRNSSDQLHMQQIRNLVTSLGRLDLPVWDYFLFPTRDAAPISLRRRGQFLLP